MALIVLTIEGEKLEKTLKLLKDLRNLDMDDDGDIILFNEYNWVQEIKEAYDEIVCYKALLNELTENVDPDFYVELLHQVGLR